MPWKRLLLLLLTWLVLENNAWADGGTVRFSEVRGGRRITIFTTPTPICAGPVDVSVLVQEADSGSPLTELPVIVSAHPAGDSRQSIRAEATSDAATNKLMRAAPLQLDEPGRWHVDVAVDGETIGFDVEVDEALPAWVDMSLWIGWPLVAVALFAVHQWLAKVQGRISR